VHSHFSAVRDERVNQGLLPEAQIRLFFFANLRDHLLEPFSAPALWHLFPCKVPSLSDNGGRRRERGEIGKSEVNEGVTKRAEALPENDLEARKKKVSKTFF